MSATSALPPLPKQDALELLPHGKALSYVAVFEDALEQLSVLSDIVPEALKTDNKTLADKIIKILNEQKALHDQFLALQSEKEQFRNAANKTRFKDISTQIQDIQNQQSLSSSSIYS